MNIEKRPNFAFDPLSGPVASPTAAQAAAPIVLHYLQLARRHARLIFAILAFALATGLILTLLTTPIYTAQARIEISREQDKVTNLQSVESDAAGKSLEFYATQYSLLNARSLAERVARRLQLTANPAFLKAYNLADGAGPLALQGDVGTSVAEAQRQREPEVIAALLKNVAIKPVRGSSLVDVAFASPSPALAAQIANIWVDEFMQQSMDRRFASTAGARSFLEPRLQEMRRRLDKSERDLVNYATRNQIVSLKDVRSDDGQTRTTQTLVSSDLEALNRELIIATAARLQAESALNAAQSAGNSDGALQSALITELRQRRATQAAQYAQLSERFDPEYPEARALARQISTLDAGIVGEKRRVLSGFSVAFEAARGREDALGSRVATLLKRYDQQSRAAIQSNIYQREVDTNRQLHDALLQRYKEIGVAGVGTNKISVVDPATLPVAPSSPNLLLNLAIAVLGGIVLAGGAVFVLENLDEGVRSPQQISESLGIALLGAPPLVESDDPFAQLQDPKSALGESYLTVRTNLGFTTDHGAPRSFCVTSSTSAEGKTTTSLALALMLARAGRSVILVDVDLRKPSLAKQLGLANQRGVSNYLAGESDWSGLVLKTEFADVALLPAGPLPPSAPDLLSSDRLDRLVRELTQQYDHVVLDAPPLLGLSDALLIARVVEGVVFTIRADEAPLRAVRAAVTRLQESRAHIFGAVLTMYKAPHSRYDYGYGYSYSYGRDAGDGKLKGARR
jgi:succinoglycan biosynthesis transport protein ExoP